MISNVCIWNTFDIDLLKANHNSDIWMTFWYFKAHEKFLQVGTIGVI